MKSIFFIIFFTIMNSLPLSILHAGEKTTLKIEEAWARPNFGPNGAAYLNIKNTGQEKRHLVGVASPLSERVELHTHSHENGIMKMRQIKEGVKLSKGEVVNFKPGGKHIMLFGMKKKLKQGETFPLTLIFKNGEKLQTSIEVKK